MNTPKWSSIESYMRDTAIWKQNWINAEAKEALKRLDSVDCSNNIIQSAIEDAKLKLESIVKVNAV